MAVFFRDLTQRRQLEERLRQAQKMEAIGQLAGGVAHDFNNILAAIMMNVSLMQQETGLTPILRELLTELEDSAKRAATLTRQLLAFSRRQKMQPQPLELNDLLGNLLKMLRRLLGERINLIFQEATDPPWIEGDPIMMEQVVLNLCVNARDAMPQGGQLILLTRIVEMSAAQMQRHPEAPVGQYVCLTVADTGCGMDAATLEHVFEPFFTTKEVGRGSGLGLATVHGIVEQHHGWLEIESTVGQGTTFRVYLPVSTKAWAGTVEEGAIGWKGGTETILLVEDEISLRRTVALFLRRQGYTVLEAGNGFEALRQWEHHANSIALLFTDMVMPEGMTGLDLARQLRLRRAELPVIVSSGYSPDLISEDQPAQPNLLYLPKPCEPAKLARKLRSLLDQAR